jgi:type II secretion system protein J
MNRSFNRQNEWVDGAPEVTGSSSSFRAHSRTRRSFSASEQLTAVNYPHSIRAFTLIEVLLAVAIFSIVLLAINAVFFAGLRLRQQVTDNVEQAMPLNQAFALLKRDLQNAVPPGGALAGNFSSAGPTTAAASTGSSSGMNKTTTATSGLQGGLDFFTTTGVISDDLPYGDIQEVNYQLAEPLDRANSYGRDLVRNVTRNLLSTTTATSDMQRLVNNVESLDFDFFDGSQWKETWDTSVGDQGLPKAVRMRLQMAVDPAAGQRSPQPLEMVVLLATQSRTNLTQTTGGGQ